MLAGTHVLAGVALWEFTDSLPWWLRLPVVGIGGYVSHYILDSVATYHSVCSPRFWDSHWWPWYNVVLIWVQFWCVAIVIGAMAARRRRG